VTVKLLQPLGPDSPVSQFARKGGGFHHVCFRCDNLETQIPVLNDKGARLLVPAQPGEAFRNNNIAFLYAQNNLNFELIDTTEKTGWAESV
jgi:methylmalonyl-CoA/ethylmalonyl-CoA epimerase